MAKKIRLGIYVGGQGPEHKAGDVEVAKDQVEAAIAVWDSREMTEDRNKWAKNKRDTKVFWYGERCYPPKIIMRIACRKEVEQLAGRQKDSRFKLKLKEGLSKLNGGYQVLDTYAGSEALGYRVEGNVGPDRKQGQASVSSTPEASDLNPPPARVRAETYRILRDTKLVRELKVLHKNRCQICGETITLGDGTTYSEGHHIQPLGSPHNGPDRAENILILCPNHHVLCDYRSIELVMKDLRLVPKHKVGQVFVDYHNSLEAPGS